LYVLDFITSLATSIISHPAFGSGRVFIFHFQLKKEKKREKRELKLLSQIA